MSMIFLAALTLAVPATDAATIGPQDLPQVKATAERLQIPTGTLYHALTAREKPRRTASTLRLCVPRAEIVSGKQGMVCRTRTQWATLGVTIHAPARS
ncbi:MAG: hypothetical protein K2P79_09370 [Sphingomonas sp.]|nr:hypothetical protein [Sphingomonas sp.]